MTDITYKIKEFNKEDPLASIVEKSGHVVEFQMVGVNAHKDQMNKLILEITSQKELEDAKMKNIEEHHEFVQKLSDFELATAAMYWQSKQTSVACAEKLTQFGEQMNKDDAEVEEIYRQCPDLLLIPSPVEAPVAETPVGESAEAPVAEATPENAEEGVKEPGEAVAPAAEAPVEETKSEENA